jgi:hypothetical protein
MARRRVKPEMSLEDFKRWSDAEDRVAATKAQCNEVGGPSVSLVPKPTTAHPDILPDEVSIPARPLTGPVAVPFTPQPSRKTGGWSADRQRNFIEALAETGCVHQSTRWSGLSARSVYALRVRSPAFAAAWDAAQQLAVGRLSSIAFDRAIHGRVEQIYFGGELLDEKRIPSDRLLMWLLARLDPKRFAFPWERGKDEAADPQREAQQDFSAKLAALTDTPEDSDPPEE